MRRAATTLSYASRIERVVTYIADHLDDDLPMVRLAEVAALSPFHFHRVFRAVMGETVADCVRRLRLHRAAVDLAHGGLAMARIARRAGYGSAAAFTRAFAADYGLPPMAYRERGAASRPGTTRRKEDDSMHDVTIENFSPMRLIGRDHRGDYNGIGKSFEQVFAWAGPRGLVGADTCMLGVYYDDPDAVPKADLRSFAGVSVKPDVVAEGDMKVLEIPALRAARLVFKGPYAELPQAYRHLYRQAARSRAIIPASKSISTIRANCRRANGSPQCTCRSREQQRSLSMRLKKSWREKLSEDHGLPEVKPIPERMQRRHGAGTIVIPTPREVDALMRRVPKGRLATGGVIADAVARRHGATIGCTVTAGIFAWLAANAAGEDEERGAPDVTPYWRMLKAGGALNPKYPGGIANLRRRLEAEGHRVVERKQGFFVDGYESKLAVL
jgi:AraC family transcriptional regulator